MNVPLLDLTYQHQPIDSEIQAAVGRVLASHQFIMGPEVAALEKEVAAYCRARHAVGVSSGTDALLVALMALDIRPGDLVLTTPFSFFATAGVVARLGARPVFVDIDPVTYNLDPVELDKVWEKLSKEDRARMRAIMPVHLYGQCADMQPIVAFAAAHELAVVEDAAQAIGAEYPDAAGAVQAGTLGQIGCFSFFPSKNLGGFGDGGMVVTGDDALAERLRILRVHGAKPKYYHHLIGGNFRLDALQAALLRVKLPHLDGWHRQRQANAARYDALFQERGLTEFLTPPAAVYREQGLANYHIYNQYVIRASQRDDLQAHLTACTIGTAVYYPVPFHLQPCFAHLGYGEGDFPVSEQAAQEVLAIPVYPGLTASQQEYVVDCIDHFYRER